MKFTLYFQILLIVIIGAIIGLFYYNFFYLVDEKKSNIKDPIKEKAEQIVNDKISNELINIEYNSSDEDGNTYYINAKKAVILNDEKQKNLVQMEGVVAIINLINKENIYVYAESAVYNKFNHNTLFYNQVKIDYLNNSILSNNLDILFTEKISKIYNEVVFKNNSLDLYTDRILIDMKTGNIKLEMINNTENVQLIAKNGFIN
tara:strand:+ start:1574 stop:2185 length:612 start_codon:yes stop_codon:yes gene_type:complete